MSNMKKLRKKRNTKLQERGITLIALVVTIIVLLILAGVSIQMLTGQTGILSQARRAVKATKEGEIIEDIQLKLFDDQIDNQGIKKKSDLIILLSQYGTVKEENGKIKSIVLEDGTEIAIERIYTGEIIEDNATYIYTKEELEDFRNNVNLGKTYENATIILMSDIDLKGNESDPLTWWTPIGSYHDDIVFKGTFDGNNHEIKGIYNNYENTTEYVAVFSAVCNATIKNLTASGTLMSNGVKDEKDKGPAVSGIVGLSYGKTTIENCVNKINVSNLSIYRDAAGILGSIWADENVTTDPSIVTVKKCSNYGTISGGNCKAGIVGFVKGKLNVENCINYGVIENDAKSSKSGGILGLEGTGSEVIIQKSSNKGSIASGDAAGGCLGSMESDSKVEIKYFENSGNVTGGGPAGGCLGFMPLGSNVKVEYFENSGNVTGGGPAGGCMSSARGNCTISNAVNKCEKIESTKEVAGGIVGYGGEGINLIINNSYNTSMIVSYTRESGGIVGDTDAITYLINLYNEGKCISNLKEGGLTANGSVGGIIGSSYLADTVINIVNAYNSGEMEGKNASGIIGVVNRKDIKVNIRNVYNVGTLNGTSNEYGIAYINSSESVSNVSIDNAFYLNDVNKGINLEGDTINTTEKSDNEVKLQKFVDKLNAYVEKNPAYTAGDIAIELLKWQLNENNYPTMKFKS